MYKNQMQYCVFSSRSLQKFQATWHIQGTKARSTQLCEQEEQRKESKLHHMLTNFGLYYKSNEKFGDFVFGRRGRGLMTLRIMTSCINYNISYLA